MSKGWHNEPNRHALAAMGMKTSDNHYLQKTDIESYDEDDEKMNFYAVDICGSMHYMEGSAIDIYEIPREWYEKMVDKGLDNLEILSAIKKSKEPVKTQWLSEEEVDLIEQQGDYDAIGIDPQEAIVHE